MEETINNLISEIEGRIKQFYEENHFFLKSKIDELQSLQSHVFALSESWCGSWIGYQSKLYYRNFEKIPSIDYNFDIEFGSHKNIPSYWQEKTYDDVLKYVKKKIYGLDIEIISEQISQILDGAMRIKNEIVADLVILRDNPKYSTEVEILEKLVNHKWGASINELNNYRLPKHTITRDTFALAQGFQVPPHIYFENKILSELSIIQSIEEFIDLSNTLVRQMKAKAKYRCDCSQEDSVAMVRKLLIRFHQVSRQLRVRHENRETLNVEDEYDVQDLLHSLLKIFFDDIRSEEWTPQYAGGAARMDFLLKNEGIVIEVKKTRPTLLAKQIGEQLIIDIIKYKQYQECKILICFIYDPEGRIGNPRGLEVDLNQMTTDDLQVIVIVIP